MKKNSEQTTTKNYAIGSLLSSVVHADHLLLRTALVIFVSCGGFYAAQTGLMSVFLCAYLIYLFKKQKGLIIAPGLIEFSVFAMVTAYCIGIITGIDKGMALTGASKYFCLLPFLLILMQFSADEKAGLIRLIPITGVISVILCTVLSITPLRGYVFIANRMSGFMGYANTFAFLMLAGILCEYFYFKKNPVILLILSIGLFWSGSRTVFVMFILAVIFIAIRHLLIADHYNIKHIIYAITIFIIIVIVSLLIPATSGIFKRLTDISVNSSTFQGRLLYMLDALPLIKRFPLGLGSYGYSYAGRLTATGLYNVKYIHNCVLQLAVDTGIVPAAIVILMFVITWIKNRNYTLLFLFSHALMDIDFEYVAVFFMFILIAEGRSRNKKVPDPQKQKTGTKNISAGLPGLAVCFIFAIVAIPPSLSNMFFLFEDNAAAVNVFAGNTEAREERMTDSYDLNEIIDDADYLITHNAYNARGYQMSGTIAYLSGDAEQTVYFLSKELELVPYAGSEYRSFATYLSDLAHQAKATGDIETFDYCIENIRIIYDKMQEKKNAISFFGSRISEQPALYLDADAMALIENTLE